MERGIRFGKIRSEDELARLIHPGAKCGVVRVEHDWVEHETVVTVPDGHNPDKTGGVRLAQALDPDVVSVSFVDEVTGVVGTRYQREGSSRSRWAMTVRDGEMHYGDFHAVGIA